ncbi:hypothetical protein CQW23_14738 [Capsicum baccatum]|uniref:VQ domain-containing protein n=1 Tax=Capsicum baccatum TaxID=33114 RepID=A0A2G2WK96_CAPBA|nr:hypothetical protein CQW23_14738 [Capsicum baccatum]
MDNSDRSFSRNPDYLGVNKFGKNIKKSPIHQPNFNNANSARQQPQPQVYNINKNDFRSIVQQLTGSPSQEPPARPPQNPSKPPSMRLQKIRPPPLNPINRPQIPIHPPAQIPAPARPAGGAPYHNNMVRPPPHYGQPSPPMLPPTPADVWTNTAESPISVYMRYLQNSIIDSGPKQTQFQGPGNFQAHPAPSGLIPNPSMPPLPSPRMNGPPPFPSTRMNGPPPFPSPKMNGPPPPLPSPRMHGPPPPLPSPRMNGPPPRMNGPPPPLPSPGINGPPPLPSPTSQYLLPSPTGFLNLLSPRSPYPLLSPGMQHPPPLTPSFFFSPMAQPGVLGQGPQFPPSPGYGFPLSPGFFPVSSPRWRDQ